MSISICLSLSLSLLPPRTIQFMSYISIAIFILLNREGEREIETACGTIFDQRSLSSASPDTSERRIDVCILPNVAHVIVNVTLIRERNKIIEIKRIVMFMVRRKKSEWKCIYIHGMNIALIWIFVRMNVAVMIKEYECMPLFH